MTTTPAHTHLIDGHYVATWIEPIIHHAREHGWKGSVTSGYRSYEAQAALYKRYVDSGFNNRYIAAKAGQSNHQGVLYPRGAIDVSQPQAFRDAIRDWHGEHKLRWAEDVGLADTVHFSATGR